MLCIILFVLLCTILYILLCIILCIIICILLCILLYIILYILICILLCILLYTMLSGVLVKWVVFESVLWLRNALSELVILQFPVGLLAQSKLKGLLLPLLLIILVSTITLIILIKLIHTLHTTLNALFPTTLCCFLFPKCFYFEHIFPFIFVSQFA